MKIAQLLLVCAFIFSALPSQAAIFQKQFEGTVKSFDSRTITVENRGRHFQVPRKWLKQTPTVGKTVAFNIDSKQKENLIKPLKQKKKTIVLKKREG